MIKKLQCQTQQSHDDEKRARTLARFVANWPAIDRERWAIGCSPADPFDDPQYGTTLRLTSRLKIAKGYARWLCFLRETEQLDQTAPPEARISNERSASYFRALKARGNRPFTIAGRFSELNMAIKILAPHADRDCVLRPYGASVRTRLLLDKRMLLVPDAQLLYEAGIRLMDSAAEVQCAKSRSLQMRDGLIFAIFAARARRLSTITRTTMSNLRHDGEQFHLDYKPHQNKTNVADDILLPRRLSPYVDHYIREVRPSLLLHRPYNALWISRDGRPLTERGIEQIVRRRSQALLGTSIGPHRFRYALATTAPLLNRAQPGLARAVLNISAQTAAQHYNRANTTIALEAFHETMLDAMFTAQERQRLADVKRS